MITFAAWVLAGIALWFTRGALDVFGNASQTTRVAMLPSLPELAGLIVLALLGAAGLRTATGRLIRDPVERRRANLQISAPLFGLAVLALPYLPWLPDAVPQIRVLAGPMSMIVWFVVAGLVCASVLSLRSADRRTSDFSAAGRVSGTMLVFLATIAVAGTAGWRLLDSLTYPSSDESHYMIMMQSLWRDHDVVIQGHDALEAPAAAPTVALGRADAAHPIGLAVLGAPIFAWRGYHGVVWMQVLLTALSGALMWRWAFAHTGSSGAATFSWAAVFLSAPLVLASISVYPEIPAALCVMVALAWRSSPHQPRATVGEYIARGLAISALPWLSMTYAPVAAVLAVLLGIRGIGNPRAVAALLSLFSISFVACLASYSAAPPLGNPLAGALGLLFDQELGAFPYAPLMVVGLLAMWRMAEAHDPLTRARGWELIAVFAALLVGVGAVDAWWGGAAPPARPLVPALPVLGLAIAHAYQQTTESPTRRAAHQILMLVGIAVSFAMIFGENGGLIAQDRDGSSRLLQWISSLWPAWEAAPAIAAFGVRQAAPLVAVWLVVATAVRWLCGRASLRSAGPGTLAAFAFLTCGALAAGALGPRLARPASAWLLQPASRSRVPILDSFDAVARPHAIIYNPMTFVPAADIPPLMTLAAAPGERPGGQPVRVLLNARYALPAGEYEVEIGGLDTVGGFGTVHGTVALQIGRIGSPIREWDVDIPAGGSWRAHFTLPVDAEFVGFVVPPPLDSATVLRVRPLTTVDKSRREANLNGRDFTILSAVAFPQASLFFHDEDVYPERTGVWIHGESTASMTVVPEHAERGVILRVHSGAAANVVTFATTTWGARVTLVPGVPREIQIPPPPVAGPFLLRVTTANGFVPAALFPGSTDRRILGCWMEIAE